MSVTVEAPAKPGRRAPQSAAERRRLTRVRKARRLLRNIEHLLGTSEHCASDETDQLDVIVAQIDVITTDIVDRLNSGSARRGITLGQLGAGLVELQRVRSEINDDLIHERLDRLETLEAGLAPLRWIHDPDKLLSKVCETVVQSGGFDRAMLSRVEDSIWRPWKSYAISDRRFERTFGDWMRTVPEIPLDHLLLESEMVRRHGPTLVTDPANDTRVFRPMVEASGGRPYVAAPLMPTGRVIGFLHADYEASGVSELDKDVLWAFAESFGHIFERAVLITRLRDQRERVHEAMQTVERVLEDLASAEIELSGVNRPATPFGAARLPRVGSSSASRFASLLTPRELEVLSLMATGATNSRIAEQLVITDGTVKSHVKQILRKLRSANRTEAIVRYLRATAERPPAGYDSRS
jgi:DNA-binding CsgD family transcriptional regulator